jgi:hypothetical protein
VRDLCSELEVEILKGHVSKDHVHLFVSCPPHLSPRLRRSGTDQADEPVPASIRARVGNKLGTVLATPTPCGHNAKIPRRRGAGLGFADFKHHLNLFPMRRLWQTTRTQNPDRLPSH